MSERGRKGRRKGRRCASRLKRRPQTKNVSYVPAKNMLKTRSSIRFWAVLRQTTDKSATKKSESCRRAVRSIAPSTTIKYQTFFCSQLVAEIDARTTLRCVVYKHDVQQRRCHSGYKSQPVESHQSFLRWFRGEHVPSVSLVSPPPDSTVSGKNF